MKNTLLVLCFLVTALAHAGGSESITYNGSNSDYNLELDRSVYRTEYRTEYYEDTCSREVFDGTYESCTQVPHETCTGAPAVCRYVCHQGPDGEICKDVCSSGNEYCSTEYTQSCTTQNSYRTEYYSCTKSHEVPYQVFDHYFKAKVAIKFDIALADIKLNEVLNFSLSENNLLINASSTSKQVLLFAVTEGKKSIQGDTETLESTVNISMKVIKNVEAGLVKLDNINLSQTKLSFESGSWLKYVAFTHDILIKRNMFLNHSEKFSGSLHDSDFIISESNGKKVYTYDFAAKGIKLRRGKFKVQVTSSAMLDGKTAINPYDLPLLNQTKVIELKVKKD
ncbi:MAG: hypothetical protein ACOYL6_10340 [Bacteriovoracaceae bacterium]